MKYESFRDMTVWQKTMTLSVEVFKPTKDLPRCEDYGLTSQIRRSSNNVSANIAEAFGEILLQINLDSMLYIKGQLLKLRVI